MSTGRGEVALSGPATDREVEEAIARCVAAAVFLCGCSRADRATALADIHEAAASVGSWGMTWPRIRDQLLRPVEAELLARYGPDEGARLNREFTEAFEV